jgi:hypothetical protein
VSPHQTAAQLLYHSSPFAAGFPYDDWTHLGTFAAALARISQTREQDYGLTEGTPATLYQVRLHGRTYPRTLTDEQANDIWGAGHTRRLADDGLPPADGCTIFRYVNDAESPGSLSYLAHRSAIRVAGAIQVPRPQRTA